MDEFIENCHNLDFFVEKFHVSTCMTASGFRRAKSELLSFCLLVALVGKPIEFRLVNRFFSSHVDLLTDMGPKLLAILEVTLELGVFIYCRGLRPLPLLYIYRSRSSSLPL